MNIEKALKKIEVREEKTITIPCKQELFQILQKNNIQNHISYGTQNQKFVVKNSSFLI
jgi:hypothetical protein